MIQLIENSEIRKDWNAKALHPMQSWEWGEARREMGLTVVRIADYNEKELVGVFQMTVHPIPKTPFKIGYVPRSGNPSAEVLGFLKNYGKKHNLIYIKFEPNITSGDRNTHNLERLVKSDAPLFPKWTQSINLQRTEEELLRSMKPKTRYNIKLAQKKGVTVKEMSSNEGFEIFIKLYFETCKRQHYAGHNYSYHHTLYHTLKDSISHILIAFYENKAIAAYHLFEFNNVLYYPYGGSSDQYREVMGANLLMWEAIRFGRHHDCKSFDLWGSLDPDYDSSNIWAGFTRFKSGYGSEFVQMVGSYDLVVNNLLYKPLILSQKIREKLLGG